MSYRPIQGYIIGHLRYCYKWCFVPPALLQLSTGVARVLTYSIGWCRLKLAPMQTGMSFPNIFSSTDDDSRGKKDGNDCRRLQARQNCAHMRPVLSASSQRYIVHQAIASKSGCHFDLPTRPTLSTSSPMGFSMKMELLHDSPTLPREGIQRVFAVCFGGIRGVFGGILGYSPIPVP